MKPVTLIILDGVGYNENPIGNAVLTAHTPNLDYYREKYPHCLLDASGQSVGLPPGFQGSSEVGHLSMGAGRVVKQELLRINDQLTDGSLFKSQGWKQLIKNWKTSQSIFHFIGLLQDEGVHAHQDHLFKLMKQARRENPKGRIVIHPFLDGRDTPPWSTLEYFSNLRNEMDLIKHCEIGTFMGRYYGMDRSKNWKLTDMAYSCLVEAVGIKTNDPENAIKESYKKGKTPSGEKMFDEYILPHVVNGYTGVSNGDSILHTNYRQDRAIQLTKAFIEKDYEGARRTTPQVQYVGLTQYYDEFTSFLLKTSDNNTSCLDQLVGEVISDAGLRQLRLAETQKFRHVTSFFNGKSTTPFPNENQVEVPSRFDPASFADHPEMEAYNIVNKFMRLTESNQYNFILVNFANGDMVGHTGKFDSAVKAVEVLDDCIGRIVDRLLEIDGKIIITSDHGNCDQMINYSNGQVRTSHSTVPVECFYIANNLGKVKMVERGKLSDIGPTVLGLLDLPIPKKMTASNLIDKVG